MLQIKEIRIRKKWKRSKTQGKTILTSSKVERQDAVWSAEDKYQQDEDIRINNKVK